MKRILFILALVMSLTSLSSFATEKKVAPAVLATFSNSFKNATEVEWTSGENFYKASFNLNGQYLSAFFSPDGQLLAATRNISPVQLPLALQTSMKKFQEGYWITSLFEVANDNGTTYYITLENADEKIVYKSAFSQWTVYQKQVKS